MENFEYSILLNDRDWAEFYLASEECNLILPALVTAEEQVLSDLEEGEAEENRLIRVRVGPVPPVHDAASCLSHRAPDACRFAEDVLSGSEDETDLGSVSRFLCNGSGSGSSSNSGSHPSGAGFPHSSCAGEYQLPCAAASKTLGRQCGEAKLNPVFSAKEGEPERGEGPIKPGCPSAVGAASPLPEENLQEQCPGHQGGEIPARPVGTSLESTEEMESSEREKENAPLRSEFPLFKEEMVSVAVPLPKSVESTAVFGKAELPSVCSGSPLAPKPGGSEDPEKSVQVVLRTVARPFQEKPSIIQEQLVLAGKASVPPDPISKSHGESPPGRVRQTENKAMDLKKDDDGRKEVSCPILEEKHQADHRRFSPCDKVEQPFLGGLEGNIPPNPTQAADSSCDKTLNKHRETAASSAGMTEEGNSQEHCRHLGMDASVQEGPYPVIEGGTRSEFRGESILYGLTVEDSSESNFTDITLPEMYDYFFGDDGDAKEKGGKPVGGHPSFYTATELPNLDGPEMYEYFFSEVDIKKEGPRDKPPETFLSSDHPSAPPSNSEDPTSEVAAEATYISIPEVYEHFFASETRDKRSWRGVLLSLPAAEARKAARALRSLLCRPVHRFRSQPTRQGALLRRSSQGKLVLLSTLLLDESRLRPEDGRMALMQPERPLPVQPILTHRDMCLGFVAFASWAVKTSDLQAPDAWKIVLLANFGTLSAIRYFRRQVVTGQHET